ncbi:formyltetrahydrofolate deformylase [Alicyclobacillus sp. ALC3]|uniref:formyltetrahydrofolate deformylase n=1 Tax=Alicyclobacillus sp. ALC3 TaxID=2796143 RepID=UPI002377F2B0|nr:formyltetrahydrofolate deformylase [Alicyclobacillus sp. ALC3]WDL95744.1 formyltetrahydrofolate deformylase [Alicyclobacillus sp. ALC3]
MNEVTDSASDAQKCRNLETSVAFNDHSGRSGNNRARLLVSCPDRPGIIAAVTQFLASAGCNILEADQHTSPSTAMFFMRIEFEHDAVSSHLQTLRGDFASVAVQFEMNWQMELVNRRKRVAVFVSKELHCLTELLWQWQAGDLFADISMVVSNHNAAEETVRTFGIPFYHLPISRETKLQVEARQRELLGADTDLIVLARYMQILSPEFAERFPRRIINIHHSFLPSFIGKQPYERAFERGVKLIGATAHYVTADLDAGPIIEQDVHRITHRHEVDDLKRIGRLVERTVLARAVKWHLEDRVLTHGNKTVVFAQ